MIKSDDHLWVASGATLQVVAPKARLPTTQAQQSPPSREWSLEEYKANYQREMQLRKNLEADLQKSRKETQELQIEVLKLQKVRIL
jgi:hypothetical protein